MFIEAIVLNENDVINAQNSNIDRVELVSEMALDGLSPSLEIVARVCAVATIPVRVMVRFHNNGFVYSNSDIIQMCNYIDEIAKYKIEGIVCGGLLNSNEIDENFLKIIEKKVIEYNLKWTFHRAIDYTNNLNRSLKILQKYKVDTILTSGDIKFKILENMDLLKSLKDSSPPCILLGGGLKYESIKFFKKAGFSYFHLGSALRKNADFMEDIDSQLVSRIKEI